MTRLGATASLATRGWALADRAVQALESIARSLETLASDNKDNK